MLLSNFSWIENIFYSDRWLALKALLRLSQKLPCRKGPVNVFAQSMPASFC
jgi:hypothetical protein